MTDKSELLQQLKLDRSQTHTTNGIKAWQILLLLVFCCGLSVWITLSYFAPVRIAEQSNPLAAESNRKVQSSTSVPTESVEPNIQPSDTILNSSGYITARRMATVSSEVMGLITQVNVEEGMNVEEGQILATLDSQLAEVNLDYARAQFAVLQARRKAILVNLDEAKINYKRTLDNTYSSEVERTRGFANQQSLQANLESADADLLVAKIEIRRQQERLDDHTIRAPFSGVVTQKNAQPGEIVAPSSAGGGFTRTGICTIVDMSSLEIEVDVNESFIGRVYPGQKVNATLDAYPDWPIPASVIATIPTADRAKATVQVRIKIELEDSRILPEMGVKVGFMRDN
ncbi:efflux RND transporter periplasmic adaptor subunit [uncultured Paraglaciecola sp.]|mgnify:CR=1 FL=1|uniref:efflux RND transporter periplasmic adaptor subunit n=1 Tax=uncultured Paraglaciecola sp. TaxID=1765024 RepID=UPI0025DC12D4|nr:efflux RND transporter periplasmic adaptor subunit [uncultured Paraglaciecola sp.]